MDAKDAVIKSKGGSWYELPDGTKVKGRRQATQAWMRKQSRQQGGGGRPASGGGGGSSSSAAGSSRARRSLSLSSLTARSEIARRAGTQFKGDRDIYTVAGYVDQGQEKFEHYWNLYERSELAGRIIDLAPKTTWKKPPRVAPAGEDPDEPGSFTSSFEKLAKRLRLWNRFERADRLSRIGRYGIIFIGTPGDDQSLDKEMESLRGPEDVLYLTAFHEDSARVKTWVDDPTNERHDLPETYEVKLSSNAATGGGPQTREIHWSRVIHIAEDVLENDVEGRPALKRCLNRIYDVDKVAAATGEAYWQLASRILTGVVNPDMEMDDGQFDELGENLQEIVHDLRRQFLGEGVELKWLESETPDASEVIDMFFMLLAVGSGIPKRILFGTETGERASEQDERQWLGSVQERREQHAEPLFVRALVDRLLAYGGLPKPETGEDHEAGEYEVMWPSLFEQTEEQIAQGNRDRAETARILTPVGSDPMELVEIDEDRNVWLKTSRQIEEEQETRELEEEEDEQDVPPPIPPIPDEPEEEDVEEPEEGEEDEEE